MAGTVDNLRHLDESAQIISSSKNLKFNWPTLVHMPKLHMCSAIIIPRALKQMFRLLLSGFCVKYDSDKGDQISWEVSAQGFHEGI